MSTRATLLIIDDSHDTLDLLELFLYREYEIFTELNGFEGLKRAEKILPDLIITDIMMPEMDGIRFINRIRKIEGLARIPVIAVTSFSQKYTAKSLLNVGFSSVIAKPFNRQIVLETVGQALTNAAGPLHGT
jgi:two-component system sensor histidine kinase ChiS